MTAIEDHQITRLLESLGDSPDSLERLTELVYEDIHRLAHHQRLNLSTGETLRTTALVHEAFLKIFRDDDPGINDRNHLMRLMARAMRQVIVDHARKRLARKRGSGAVQVPLEVDDLPAPERDTDAARIIEMEAALEHLALIDPELVDLVSARFYAGYSAKELAEMTGASVRTIYRELKRASAWLKLGTRDETGIGGA